MNLNNFLSFRESCPVCRNPLSIKLSTKGGGPFHTVFHTKIHDNHVSIFFEKKIKDRSLVVKYLTNFIFQKNNGQFDIKFIKGVVDESTKHLKHFKELNKIYSPYYFENSCQRCSYKYGSTPFNIDIESKAVEPFSPKEEFCSVSKWVSDDNNLTFKIHNNLSQNKCDIYMLSGNDIKFNYSKQQFYSQNQVHVPLSSNLEILNQEKLFDRLKNMVNFL
jgi:hypothetical protein